jgi:hypothetical protein
VNIGDLVLADFETHIQKRIDYHGAPLLANQGPDKLLELYEQLMDACLYVRGVIEETR